MISRQPPLCKFCRQRTDSVGRKLHEECITPWLAAEKLRKAAIKAKVDRSLLMEYRAKNKTIADRIREAQIQFNKFIRCRDRDKGCFVCGRSFSNEPGYVQHAGHVRSRGAAGHLRFNEDNCHGECEGCNGPHGAKPHEIKAGAIRRVGQAIFDALENDNTIWKWNHAELIEIKIKYRAKRKALEKTG